MKKYKGKKQLETIISFMRDEQFDIYDKDYNNGMDHISFHGFWNGWTVAIIYNTFNGQFQVYNGITQELLATESSTELDNEQWYQKLLDALYEVA